MILVLPGTVLAQFVFLCATRLPPAPHPKFQVKESRKKLTCFVGGAGGASRSQEVRGACLTG